MSPHTIFIRYFVRRHPNGVLWLIAAAYPGNAPNGAVIARWRGRSMQGIGFGDMGKRRASAAGQGGITIRRV